MISSLLKMDGITYKVRVTYDSMVLSFSFVEGENSGLMLSGYEFLDTLGTGYGHRLDVEPDPAHPEDYDALFHAISSPKRIHTVELPYGQTTITYDAKVTGGQVTFAGHFAGKNRWHGLHVSYEPIQPQRTSD